MASTLKVNEIQHINGTSAMTIDTNGFVAPKVPSFHVRLSSSLTHTDVTWTRVNFDVENWDTAGWYDNTTNYRFTPQVAGYYQFSLTLSQSDGSNTQIRTIGSISKNGDYGNGRVWDLDFDGSGLSGLTESKTQSGTMMYYANGTTDYFEAYSWINLNTGSPQIVNTVYTSFGGFLISAA